MTMPILSGDATFRQLRLIQPDVKVALSGGFNEVEAIRRFTGKGSRGLCRSGHVGQAGERRIRRAKSEPARY